MDSMGTAIILLLWKALFLAVVAYLGLRAWAKNRWQFSVRTLLIVATVAAVALGTIRAMFLY